MEDEYVNIGVDDESSTFVDNDDCLKHFIEAYENLPELWNKMLPSYMNKYKKQTALEKLLVIYKDIKPQATIKDVSKKLNTLRSNFRREQNKIKSSLRSGSGTDEVYKPTSWVFYALKFLQDSESPAPLTSQNETPQESQGEGENYSNSVSENVPGICSLSSITSYPVPAKKKKVQGPIAKQNELLKVACDYLSNSASQDDEYLNLAKVWANKLKTLKPLQKTFAEKAINDILFEAEMETLHRDSVQINNPNTSTSTILRLSYSRSSSSTLISPLPMMSPSSPTTYDNNAATYFSNYSNI